MDHRSNSFYQLNDGIFFYLRIKYSDNKLTFIFMVFIIKDLRIVHDTWKVVDEQINDPNSRYLAMKIENLKINGTNKFKPIRVFVSSTFTDMFNEREILVKQVRNENLKLTESLGN